MFNLAQPVQEPQVAHFLFDLNDIIVATCGYKDHVVNMTQFSALNNKCDYQYTSLNSVASQIDKVASPCVFPKLATSKKMYLKKKNLR